MSFGKRRPKLSRAQLRPSNPIAIQQGRLARQRDRLIRLAVVGVAVLAGAAIVHGSGPPFIYRLGQRPDREVRVYVKEFLRRIGARAKEHLYEAIGEGLREVTPRDIFGWFRHAGLCVMQA